METDSLRNTFSKLFSPIVSVISETLDLAALELRLAGKSLVLLIWLYLFVGLLFISTWLFLLVAVVFWLISLHISLLTALMSVVGVNVFLIILTLISIASSRRDLTFPATRKQLNIHGKYGESDEKFEHRTTEEKNSPA